MKLLRKIANGRAGGENELQIDGIYYPNLNFLHDLYNSPPK